MYPRMSRNPVQFLCTLAVGLLSLTAAPALSQEHPDRRVKHGAAATSDDSKQLHALTHAALAALAAGSVEKYMALHPSYAELGRYFPTHETEEEVLAERRMRITRLLPRMRADGVELSTIKLVSAKLRR